jgi:large conductance mechanosensitive channel
MAQPLPPPPAKKNVWREFRDFLNQGDFLTIAIGLILALYFQQIVNAILRGILYPIIAAIFGKPDFTQIGFDIGDARISIGLVLDAIISFVVVGFLLFLIVKAFNAMRRTKDSDVAETELSVLREIREELRSRN